MDWLILDILDQVQQDSPLINQLRELVAQAFLPLESIKAAVAADTEDKQRVTCLVVVLEHQVNINPQIPTNQDSKQEQQAEPPQEPAQVLDIQEQLEVATAL
jgi:hypothetical protein